MDNIIIFYYVNSVNLIKPFFEYSLRFFNFRNYFRAYFFSNYIVFGCFNFQKLFFRYYFHRCFSFRYSLPIIYVSAHFSHHSNNRSSNHKLTILLLITMIFFFLILRSERKYLFMYHLRKIFYKMHTFCHQTLSIFLHFHNIRYKRKERIIIKSVTGKILNIILYSLYLEPKI